MTAKTTPLTLISDKYKGTIWSHVRQKSLFETPEERVRQEHLCVLVNEFGYQPDQIGEELDLAGGTSGGNS